MIFRTRFKKEIVAEFILPKRASRKVIILSGGMPGYGRRDDVMNFLSEKGYWVINFRYRGSWESGGSFLELSPHQDVLDIVEQLPKGFVDLAGGKKYKILKPEVYLVGSSFGGPAAILASRDPRIKKIAALSPVIDWRIDSKLEPLDWMGKFTRNAFGNGYRFAQKDWDKLKTGTFYNPIHEIGSLDAQKICIFHAKDDEIVYYWPSEEFAKVLGCTFHSYRAGGHFSMSYVLKKPEIWKKIDAFFKKK